MNANNKKWVFHLLNGDEYTISGDNIMFNMDSEGQIMDIQVYREGQVIFSIDKRELKFWAEKRYFDYVD